MLQFYYISAVTETVAPDRSNHRKSRHRIWRTSVKSMVAGDLMAGRWSAIDLPLSGGGGLLADLFGSR
tara:strand:- start:1533 stop:1736 length:204 start_codon:yes stop_codon:yes gene_type:complete